MSMWRYPREPILEISRSSAYTSPERAVITACVILPSDRTPSLSEIESVVHDALSNFGIVKYADANFVEEEEAHA